MINIIPIFFIKLYQKITKNSAHKCLFYPSCSNYSIISYQKYPFPIATKMTINRIRDCHPFSNRPYLDYP